MGVERRTYSSLHIHVKSNIKILHFSNFSTHIHDMYVYYMYVHAYCTCRLTRSSEKRVKRATFFCTFYKTYYTIGITTFYATTNGIHLPQHLTEATLIGLPYLIQIVVQNDFPTLVLMLLHLPTPTLITEVTVVQMTNAVYCLQLYYFPHLHPH